MDWQPAFALSLLPVGGAKLFKYQSHRIAVFRPEENTLYAVDDRCPHEGYPLVQGSLCGNTLTCCWHNYKFDLPTGACLVGEEGVRTWQARIQGEQVEINITVDNQRQIESAFRSLREGLFEHRTGRMARDTVRLLSFGISPEKIVMEAVVFDSRRAEWGPSHVLALGLDALTISDRLFGLEKSYAICAVLDQAGRASMRRPLRELQSIEFTEEGASETLFTLVESEKASAAEAWAKEMTCLGRAVMEPAIFSLCAAHFLDFGHQLIYASKAFDLLERAGWEYAETVLPALVYGITMGTREDVLPEWALYRKWAAELDLDALFALPRTHQDPAPLIERLLQSPSIAFSGVVSALKEGMALESILNALSLAAAERMLRFRVAIDHEGEFQENWLDVTHLQTFAQAVRAVLSRWPSPRSLLLILQATRFITLARPLDGQRPDWQATGGLSELLSALKTHNEAAAIGAAESLLQAGEAQLLQNTLEDLAMKDKAGVRAIVVTHLLKNSQAAFTEYRLLKDPRHVLGLVRVFASGLCERRVGRQVQEAIRLIRDGKPPKKLTG